MLKTKFILIRGMTGYIIPFLLKDLENRDDVILRKGNIVFKSKLQYYMYKIHNSKRINQVLRLPGRSIWLKKELSFLENYHFEDDTKYYVIVLNLAAATLAFPRIESIKRDNVKLVLAFFDPIKNEYCSKLAFENRESFDLVMTFDDDDANKYGFKHFFQRYSKFELVKKEEKNKLYFIGHPKGRTELLSSIGVELKRRNIPYCFKVAGSKDRRPNDGIEHLKKSLLYPEVLKDIEQSSCLLEIVQDGQSGATARYLEAVCYNKKLLTNNQRIIEFPYYNDKYMKIFTDNNDIDYEWLQKDEVTEYGYKDDFTPIHWLESLVNEL